MQEPDAPGIAADITYLAPGSYINRRFVAPAREVNTGEYSSYPVTIRDARSMPSAFTPTSHGFELHRHHSAVRVATMSWMVRTSGDLSAHDHAQAGYQHSGGVQPPAGEVHCDASPDRVDAFARKLHAERFPGVVPYSRFLHSSFWRAFSPPPQDYPLALCDGNSVGDDEGVPNTLFVVDTIPSREEMLKPVADENQRVAAAIFHHNPAHRWWYFSNMTRDEVLLIVFHDSRRVRPWRVPHTAFRDLSRSDAKPRASIEFRTVAYFA